jgi:hypothetical protein
MKPYGSIWVVRMWCDIRTNSMLRCFDNPEGLCYEDLLVGVVPKLLICAEPGSPFVGES